MLGKASEISVTYITAIHNDLDDNIIDWLSDHDNAVIIDINFTSTYDHDNKRMFAQALIIYKAAETNKWPCPICKDPFCVDEHKEAESQ